MTFVFDIDGTLSFDGRTTAPPINEALDALLAAGHRVITTIGQQKTVKPTS